MMKIKRDSYGKKQGCLVLVVFLLFYFLERCSVFYWVNELRSRIYKKRHNSEMEKGYLFPEIWVVGNICGAILFQNLVPYTSCEWMLVLMIVYAIERVLEMLVYQVNVLFFHRLKSHFIEPDEKNTAESQEGIKEDEVYKIKSSTRTVLLLILNMVEYVLQFAVIYAALNQLSGNWQELVDVMGSFRVFMNMTDPEEFSGNLVLHVAYIETVIGMFMNIICLAKFVGILPEVKEIDK